MKVKVNIPSLTRVKALIHKHEALVQKLEENLDELAKEILAVNVSESTLPDERGANCNTSVRN